ncbi:MAG: TnsA-like heteromeric transposase endonuclease subunit [Pseudonocardiaceae bacterium]
MGSGVPAVAVGLSRADGFGLRYLETSGAGYVEREGALTACWNGRFEDVPPVRNFPSYQGQRSFSGLYFAACMGRHVGFESWLERDQFVMLDFSPTVGSFSCQPFWLLWSTAGKARRHAPDVFVRLRDGTGMVVDVRADDRIAPEDAEVFEVTAAACESVGWAYRRVGAVDPVLAANVRWLAGYRHSRCMRAEYAVRLREVFAAPVPLLAGAEAVGDRIAVLPTLFHLMWAGTLVADLASAPLNGASLVTVAGGAR